MAFEFYKARTSWDVGEMVFSFEILAMSDCSLYGMDRYIHYVNGIIWRTFSVSMTENKFNHIPAKF